MTSPAAPTGGTPINVSNPQPTNAGLLAEVRALAKQAGDKYFFGGTNPSTGFDCSGIIYDALQHLGYKNPPRTSEQQWQWVDKITKAQLQPGDLVFANFGNEVSPGHVGIYIGGGQVFSARDPALGIGVDSLASWGNNIVGYGRVPNITASNSTGVSTDASITSVLSWPGDIVGFFKDGKTFIDALLWIVNPASWLRIGSFALGVILVLFGIYALMHIGSDEPLFKMPTVVPVPV